MIDVPSPDYTKKKDGTSKTKKKKKSNDGFGTAISSLPKDVQNQIRN